MMRCVPGMDYDIEKLKMTIDDHNDIATSLYQTPQGCYVDVEEFDKAFPPKEKLKLSGQIFDKFGLIGKM